MSNLIEVNSNVFLPPSAIRRFSIDKNFSVRAWIGGKESYVVAQCTSKVSARQCIERLWADAHKESKAVTIKAKIEEE